MADVFYGINRGETAVTRDTSTTGKDVEVVVDDAASPLLKRKDVYNALNAIRDAVVRDTNFNEV